MLDDGISLRELWVGNVNGRFCEDRELAELLEAAKADLTTREKSLRVAIETVEQVAGNLDESNY